MKLVAGAISKWGQEEINQLERDGSIEIEIDGEQARLAQEEVLITSQDIPGWSVASANGITVALDVTLNDELKQEGIARDLVNRIQNLRKDMGLEVQDKITIKVAKLNEQVDRALENFSAYIQSETQALSLSVNGDVEEGTVLDMDDFELKVKVEKV